MRIGTEIYREIVNKMLSVHIATMERKLRACQQCPPRCPTIPDQNKRKRPYTTVFKQLPFIPRKRLPTYLQQKIRAAERLGKLTIAKERKIRRTAELSEQRLAKMNGNIEMLREREAKQKRDSGEG